MLPPRTRARVPTALFAGLDLMQKMCAKAQPSASMLKHGDKFKVNAAMQQSLNAPMLNLKVKQVQVRYLVA